MKNTIAERIYDFLKNYPPFNLLEHGELMTICCQVKVLYLEKNSNLFKVNEELHDSFYVVKDGAVGLFRETDLVDKCDEGDIFGLRPLIRKSNYQLSAETIEESIIYAISSRLLEEIITSNIQANKFLLASFAANTLNAYADSSTGRIYSQEGEFSDDQNLTHLQSIKANKAPITCLEGTTVKDAARKMTKNKVGSIAVSYTHLRAHETSRAISYAVFCV